MGGGGGEGGIVAAAAAASVLNVSRALVSTPSIEVDVYNCLRSAISQARAIRKLQFVTIQIVLNPWDLLAASRTSH